MKKSKGPSAKKLYEGLQKHYEEYRNMARAFATAVGDLTNRRRLMSIAPANEKGMINGLTIPELVMLVNLSEGTGEKIILETENNKRDLLIVAKKTVPTPWKLL